MYHHSIDQVETAGTIQDTTFVFIGEPEKTYSVEITPMDAGGNQLGVLRSRHILCSPGEIDPPGTPKIISMK